jgi:hypothetical protein
LQSVGISSYKLNWYVPSTWNKLKWLIQTEIASSLTDSDWNSRTDMSVHRLVHFWFSLCCNSGNHCSFLLHFWLLWLEKQRELFCCDCNMLLQIQSFCTYSCSVIIFQY